MEYLSEKFKLVLDEGGVMTVWHVKAPVPQRVTISAEGVKTEEVHDEGLRHHFASTPAYKIAFAGDGQWHVDAEAGMQRWTGTQSSRQVARALRVLGFHNFTVGQIMAKARKHEHVYMGRACW